MPAKRPAAKIGWTSEQLRKNVFRIVVPCEKNKNWQYWFLLTSDQHWDNPDSNHELQLKHLNEAKERGAGIMSAGDLFCLMQGKYDKRSNKSKVRPEHQVDDYLDAVLRTGADFFEPYAHHIVCIAEGNHEAAIRERLETSMTDRFVGILNDRTSSHIYNGAFSGWIIFAFRERSQNTSRGVVALHYDHGYGGGGPVTADMIQHQRRAVYLPDADIVVSGHTHDQWVRELARVRLDPNHGATRHDIQTHIKLASYKDEYREGLGGWATAKRGMPPKPIGAWWLRFFWEHSQNRVLYEVIRAQ